MSELIPPVVKAIVVDTSPADAFAAFTQDFGMWWPFATHSLGGDEKVEHVRVECQLGGRVLERWKDGSEHVWGTIVEWRPAARLVFTWHVGRTSGSASEVAVDFTAQGQQTLVRLTHSHWENMGDGALETRNGYDRGWVMVFEQGFGQHVQRRQA